MRPPSYYTSLANSNRTPTSYSSSSSSSSSQLRSSFSNSSASSYVTRTHLPFVSQSMLVAHCITASGSSTKPSHASYKPSTGYHSTSSNYHSTYSQTKRQQQHLPSTSSTFKNPYLAPSSSSYLASSSSLSAYSSARSYQPTTTSRSTLTSSSYYKPLKLRDRPLLTQISRQIKPTTTTTAARDQQQSHFGQKTIEEREQSRKGNISVDEEEKRAALEQEAAEWSSDVARNISRNKYLIKFREIDKPRAQATPAASGDKAQTENEQIVQTSATRSSLQVDEPISLSIVESQSTMKLPPIVASELEQVDRVLEKKTDDKSVADDLTQATKVQTTSDEQQNVDESEITGKKKPVKEKRNIKLRIKNISENKKVATNKKDQPLVGLGEELLSSVDGTEIKPINCQLLTKIVPQVEAAEIEKPIESQPIVASEPKPQPTTTTAKTEPKAKVKKLAKANSTVNSEAKDGDKQKETKDKCEQASSGVVTGTKKNKKIGENRKKASAKVDKSSEEQKATNEQQQTASEPAIGAHVVERGEKDEQAAPSVVEKSPDSSCATQTSAVNLFAPDSNASASTNKRIRFREYHFEDFNFLSVLGHGGWGFVILAELKQHDACFAVKCIKKITIVEDDDFESIMIERKVLTLGNVHPFICKLFCTFETDAYLFFVMEYCAGGDLMFHVQKEGKFSESRCRFYAAEIICAIRFLHNQHIIYRDLKLDNILLDSSGHVRLVDFGMCQCRTYREEMLPSNFCGTPEYISPEIIKGVPYNHSVDWWSFGVLLYEMAIGKMPFRGMDENELLWNVCYEQIHYPMFLTKELTSLLQLLLEREPVKRMGMATCKAGDIYDQAWFRGVDWRAIEEMRVSPPFVPQVSSQRDVQNFDTDFTQSTPELSPVDQATLQQIDQDQFQKFPYTNPNIFIFN